jgi:hypothetical protein
MATSDDNQRSYMHAHRTRPNCVALKDYSGRVALRRKQCHAKRESQNTGARKQRLNKRVPVATDRQIFD